MGTLSTTAWVLHDLGLAAGFGGPLFGEVALHKAVKNIQSEEEREKVLGRAWNTYNVVDAACLGLAAATWLIGRSRLSGREVDRHTHSLVVAKDILISAALMTGLANLVIGRKLHEHKRGDVARGGIARGDIAGGDVAGGDVARTEAHDGPSRSPAALRAVLQDPAKMKRALQVLGPLHTALVGGALAMTTVLAMRSGRSSKWSIISRFLP